LELTKRLVFHPSTSTVSWRRRPGSLLDHIVYAAFYMLTYLKLGESSAEIMMQKV
jgi:hypothetical protein